MQKIIDRDQSPFKKANQTAAISKSYIYVVAKCFNVLWFDVVNQ